MSYLRLFNQCSLFVDKIKIFYKFGGCGFYTGALNRAKFTVNQFETDTKGRLFVVEGQETENDRPKYLISGR